MNRRLDQLHSYPFAKLKTLLSDVSPAAGKPAIALTVGEPQHAPPTQVGQALIEGLDELNKYPATQGQGGLRKAIAEWLGRRYALPRNSVDENTQLLPVQGTREALFAIAQTVVCAGGGSGEKPLVILPSPFYQIYEGAAIMAGAEPLYLPCLEAEGFVPQLERITAAQWRRCQLVYVCSPSNPTGAVLSSEFYQRLLTLADQYDFVVASDECYSEIYSDESQPPVGLLQVCQQLGREDFSRCLVFNSLSKRSNLAGLRSGFVAGDAELIAAFLRYRTYHGSAMPLHHQRASIAAWGDELHVQENRRLYREKMAAVLPLLSARLPLAAPQAGFCLWLPTPIDDEQFTRQLYCDQNLQVLPGRYLARSVAEGNPGVQRVRIALVEPLAVCLEAVERILAQVEKIESGA